MANTYYDSQLTAAEIEAALEAIDGVIVPANNGKVLAINNGKIEARSVQWGGGEPVLEPLSVTANGDYTPGAGVDGFDEVHVSVPNSYTASDEGKVVSNGALVAQTARASQITQNGTYDTTLNDEETVNVSGGGSAVVQPLSVTQNGTYNPPSGVDGYAPVTVNVSGGGSFKGFEVYAADGNGSSRTNFGILNNNYFACFFDDNMQNTYTLNGVSYTYSTLATGKTGTNGLKATTRDVTNQSVIPNNALIPIEGSVFTTSHGDSGSYISVVGGWVGYPSGGIIYEHAAVGTSNSVTLNSVYETLLVFIGADSDTSGITTIDINGDTYTIENIGYHYGAYGMYTAIEISGNSDTNIAVTFPASCWSYVSVIGIDN